MYFLPTVQSNHCATRARLTLDSLMQFYCFRKGPRCVRRRVPVVLQASLVQPGTAFINRTVTNSRGWQGTYVGTLQYERYGWPSVYKSVAYLKAETIHFMFQLPQHHQSSNPNPSSLPKFVTSHYKALLLNT